MDNEARIFQKLDEINAKLAAIGERCPAREKELDDLEKRLRGVEAMQNKAIGVWSIISVVLGSLGALLTSLIKKGLAQ
jgi:hypothetical protein